MKIVIQLDSRESGWWWRAFTVRGDAVKAKGGWHWGGLLRGDAVEAGRNTYPDAEFLGQPKPVRVILPGLPKSAPMRVHTWQTTLV